MPQLTENAFTFESKALPKETFSVVRFSGEEGLSTLYRFEILLISEEQDLDIAAVLQHPATFTIKNRFANGPELPFHGILSAFEQLHQFGTYTFYRTELRPKLWWLTHTHHNQVFLDQKIDQFAAAVLQDGGLSQGMDFEFRLQDQYDPREYVCQYGESHFDFVSRWMEREGIYYWFEQGEQSEKMIAADTHIAHTPLSGHEKFIYSPPSGLDDTSQDKVIQRFSLKQTPMPKNVLLKDYNYMKPSLDLEGKAQVREQGRGEVYLYGEHFPNRSEGQRLATVRAEAYLCREKVFNSQSTVPAVRPGYLFNLERHYSNGFNRDYLTTSVHHEGSQEQYLVSGLGVKGVEDHQGLFYRNTFTCVSGDTQYRPERVTPKPRIAGSLSAKIDAAGSGKYAELDEHGRYKVILPFDLSGRKDGKGSTWIRMMQPYAGQGMGFHAPLHKGTEVLLSFIEADPDRPVISGAIPNPETPSPVHDENQTQVRLVSGSGNVMHMEDQEGRQRILLHSPDTGSFIRMGYRNDPDDENDGEPQAKEKESDTIGTSRHSSRPFHPPGGRHDHDDHDNDHDDDDHDDDDDGHSETSNTKEVNDPQGDCKKDNTRGIKVKSEDSLTFESGDSCKIVHGDDYLRVNGEERKIIDGALNHFVAGTSTGMFRGNVLEGKLAMTEEGYLGGKVELALAGVFELITGLKAEIGIGRKWTFHEMKEKWHPEENTLEGVKNALRGEINDLTSEQSKLRGNVSILAASSERLAAQSRRLAGATSFLAGQVSGLAGEENSVIARRTQAVGERMRVMGQSMGATGEEMNTIAENTRVVGIEEII